MVILGAGLTGTATALELARRGLDVTLLDQDEVCMNRAGLRNEGKIHLGLVYANDATLATAKLQLEGALCFRSLLERWVGPAANRIGLSTPFVYLVAADSILTMEVLASYYASVESLYEELLASDSTLDYLGRRPAKLFRERALDKVEPPFRTKNLCGAFEMAELAVDTDDLAAVVRKAVAESPRIRFLPSHRVEKVEASGRVFEIEGRSPEGTWRLPANQVVNALWESRLRIDSSLGLDSETGWAQRLKFRVIVELPEALHGSASATMVLGRYGDVVVRPNGSAYLSWYPAGMRGWTNETATPASWNGPCRGEVNRLEARSIASDTIAAIDEWYPGIGDSKLLSVDAGIIVAHGRTDIDDPASGLHERTRIGVDSSDGYHSVVPGKLTTAPLVAMETAKRVIRWEESR